MELRQLRYFVEVARALNFTRAAEKLHVAQPALSRQIRALEHELGVQLLDRNHRQVRLTEAGAAFFVQAEALLEQSRSAMEVARQHGSPPAPRLAIGYVWGLFHTLAPARIHEFRQSFPDVAVNLLDLSATEQAAAIKDGSLDAGFIGFAYEADAAGLQKQKVADCDFLAVLPRTHPQARQKRVCLENLADDFFLAIAEESFPGASRVMMQACARAGFKPRVLQTAERGHTLLGLVAANCGVALLPESLRALPHQGVVFRPLARTVPTELHIAHCKTRLPLVLREFLAVCAHSH